jgi:hypothetical protein
MHTPALSHDCDADSDSVSVEILDQAPIQPFIQGWPPETHLIYPATGARVALRPQSAIIQQLVQVAIQNVQISITFEDAFPDMNRRTKYNRDALYKAAKSLRQESIVTRIRKDSKYVAVLSSLVRHLIPALLSHIYANCLQLH